MKDNYGNEIVKDAFYIASKRSGSIPQGFLVKVNDVADGRILVNVGSYALTLDEFLDTFHNAPIETMELDGVVLKPFCCNGDTVWMDLIDSQKGAAMMMRQEEFARRYNQPSYKTYFTLRLGETIDAQAVTGADGNETRFDTYEEAYDVMCNIYIKSLYGKHFTYAANPIRPVIMRTTVSSYNGHINSCTQKA